MQRSLRRSVRRSPVTATGDDARPARITLEFEMADTLREVVGELGKHLKIISEVMSVEVAQRGQSLTVLGQEIRRRAGIDAA